MTMSESNVATRIEQAIRDYIQACNDGDAEKVAACFVSDAVHYFPTVAKWSGASTIGANFSKRVQASGHLWTVDKVVDADRQAGVLEWTQFDKEGRILRGVDWFVFEPGSLRIRKFALMALRQSNATSTARSCRILTTPDAAMR
jgi:hypothetical protein